MKIKLYLSILFLCLCSFLQAQTTKILNVTAGNLYASLTETERNTITTLTLIGTIDASDFRIIRDNLPYLNKLDLSEVNIVAYQGGEGTTERYDENYPANTIPELAFSKGIVTTNLTSIVFPKSITAIGLNAFNSCHGLTDIEIPSGVTSILQGAFANCKGLKSITFNSSILTIGTVVFANCNNLRSVTVGHSIPYSIGTSAFYNVDKNICVINVPYQSAANYRSALVWNEFINIAEAPGGFCISANSFRLAEIAGSKAITTISSNIGWAASSDQNWLKVSPLSGNGSLQTITLTAEENPSFINYRTAIVTISAAGVKPQVITVTQGVQPQSPKTLKITAGGLKSSLTVEELGSIRDLTLTGTMDARDFKTIRDNMPLLEKLNIGEVNITSYEGPDGPFGKDYNYMYPEGVISYIAYSNDSDKSSPIQSIVLPGSLKGIGENALHKSLTSLKVLWQVPLYVNDYLNLFSSIKNTCTLYVPYGTESRYATASVWKDFITMKEAPQGLVLSQYNDTISGAEGTSVPVDIKANIPWSISCDQEWLTITPLSGNANQTILLTASANNLLSKRKAIVTVTGEGIPPQFITIVQDIQPQPEKILELTAGNLASVLTVDELNAISILTLKGTIDARDFKTMRDKMPLLTTLDLSGATIVEYYGTEGTSASNYTYPANEIPERAFYAYNESYERRFEKSHLKSLVFPAEVTSIGYASFAYCDDLTTLNIPSSVTTIHNEAFDHCNHLINVNLSSSLKTIGYQSFYNCSGLTSLLIPSSVNTIGSEAFAYCTSLTAVNILYGVKKIETYAFYKCFKLISLSIPSSVTYIGQYAFYESYNLSQVTVNWSVPLNLGEYTYVFLLNQTLRVTNLYVPYGTVSAYASAYQWKDFKNIHEMPGFFLLAKEVTLEQMQGSTSSVVINSNIAWTATSDQAWLSISPASGTGMGQKLTFTAEANLSYGPRIAKVTISAPGVESQIITITQAQLAARVEITPGELATAFSEEDLLTINNLTITGTMDARDFKTMRDKMPMLSKIDLSSATIAAYNGSEGTNPWGYGNYPANTIPEYAFYNQTVTNRLTSISFPSSITSIGQNSFYNCGGLTDILITPKVTTINLEAFYNCSGLTSVFIPSSVTNLEYRCFFNCKKLNSITVESIIPPIVSYQGFYEVNTNSCVLNVPYKSAELYKNADQWKDFLNIKEPVYGFNLSSTIANLDGISGSKATITIDANIDWTINSDQNWLKVDPISGKGTSLLTFIADTNPSFMETRTAYVTVSVPGIASKKITVTQNAQPQPPKSFEISAGSLATVLTAEELATIIDLTITGTIDARDFKTMRDKMPLLSKINIKGATIVAYYGIEGTSTLGAIDYPANMIPEFAFSLGRSSLQGKATLTSIVLPESVTVIDRYSFSACQSLTNVIIPPSVKTIGDYAFYGCGKIDEMKVPAAITRIGMMAFGDLNSTITVDPANLHYMSNNNVLFNKEQTVLIQCVASIIGKYEIPSTVTTIGDYAFYNRGLLTSVSIPSSVGSIGNYAFQSCRELITISIPTSVTFIGGYAFAGCYDLNSIYTNSITPVNLNASFGVFLQISSCSLYVPIGSKTAYQTAYQWKDFYKIIEINPDLIANAGVDREIDEGKLTTLEGSALVNISGKPLTFKWTAPEGITLSSDTDANPTFTSPEVKYSTQFRFSLIISDGLNYSTAEEVYITVKSVNKPPVANAGPDQIVTENDLVTLDGSASYDPDIYMYHEWIAPYPIILNSIYSTKPTFKAPVVSKDQTFTFYLKVIDEYTFQTDTVIITVKNINQVPTANAGNMQIVEEGETVTLDARSSMDPDGDALTYKWTVPEGITLSSSTSVTPTFTTPTVESDTWFNFQLVVNDGKVNSATSGVSILVRNVPSQLNLVARHLVAGIPVNYQLYLYDGNSFIHKRDTFSVTGDTLHLLIEPGYWIGLVSPALDPSAFVPTWSGDVLNWNEAQTIHIPVKGNAYMGIGCISPQTSKTGIGHIDGFIYEKPDDGSKSISIAREENAVMGVPIQAALIQLYKKGAILPVASVFTDPRGYYQFEKLEIADYEIKVEIPGYIQSERFPAALSDLKPSTDIWFAVNMSTKVITNSNLLQLTIKSIYPNPTAGVVHLNGLSGKAKIAVYTMDGKLIITKETTFPETIIDLSSQVPGTYVLVVNEQRFKIIKK